MRSSIIYCILCGVTALLLGTTPASAQYFPERKMVRDGNEQFNRMNYRSSLNLYNQALEHDSTKIEILYNRANAYHHTLLQHPQDSTLRWETSNEMFEAIANDELLDSNYRAEALRNIGESLFTQQHYEAALNAFRESLLLNPDDAETKYNYILTKRIVDQLRQQQQNQQQDQQQNGNNGGEGSDQQQNQDQSQESGENNDEQQQNDQQQQDNEQQPNDNSENGENNKQEENGDEEQQEGNNDNPEQQNNDNESQGTPQHEQNMTTDEQERMLDLIQAQEDKTQDKLKDERKAIVIPGKKSW